MIDNFNLALYFQLNQCRTIDRSQQQKYYKIFSTRTVTNITNLENLKVFPFSISCTFKWSVRRISTEYLRVSSYVYQSAV